MFFRFFRDGAGRAAEIEYSSPVLPNVHFVRVENGRGGRSGSRGQAAPARTSEGLARA